MSLQPKSNLPRPALPPTRNPHLASIEDEGVQPVKYQIITRDNQEIIVGRIKIPTVENHAFILRRFDTGAISLSTMFRSAFAGITDEQEKTETTWIKASYDTAGANGGGKMRLAGTWIPVSLAVQLAPDYRLDTIIQPLVSAVPGPKSDYRKSRPNQSPAPKSGPAPALPAQAGSPAPSRGNASGSLAPTTPLAKRARKSQSPSPATAKPVGRSTPGRLRAPAIIEEEEAAKATTIDADKDIAEAKAEVAAIKAKLKGNNKGHKQVEVVVPSTPSRKKRVIDETEEAPKLNLERIKEIQENVQNGVVEERPVIPLPQARRLNPANKAAAWGTLAFFAGVAAVTYFPQVAQSFL